MALKKTETVTVFGRTLTFDDAYIKVVSVNGNKQTAEVKYAIFSKDGGDFLKSGASVFEPSMIGGNFIAQAYDHLKTLPDFDGAINC